MQSITDRKSSKVYASSVDNLDDTGKPGITLVIKNLGFQEPINRVADALQKSRIGNAIPHKELVVRNIRTVTLKPVSLVNKDGGYKITTELTPQR
ncbi:hypothetical protein MST75_003150 [Salmonella enterica]|nr:hypothetical protein [Salmonella enterica]EHM9003487.1 hypothetical protein [Salmonella enterica]EIW4274352.1 hypothetical protein [Salmonella enterica]EJB6343136.1 hypothetical protein [Salmonella enterica]EJB6558155.1 hypothetical protein [Salmonella enterica]